MWFGLPSTQLYRSTESKLQKKNQRRKEQKQKTKKEEVSKRQLEDEEKKKKGSLLWTMEMLRSDDERALKILRRWTNCQRTSEVNIDLLLQLRQLAPIQQREVLRELKRPRSWIHKINQNSVVTSVIICTLDYQCTFELNALLDCGATGCYIDEGFVRAKGLNLEPLPRPIPVYNADGSHNEGGPIRSVAKMHLQIQDHVKVFNFAVTNTGKTDLIIGYDWLRKHNPSIDWHAGSITFNHCPLTCHAMLRERSSHEPEEEPKGEQQKAVRVEEGDRIFVTKFMSEGVEEWHYWERLKEQMKIRAVETHSQKLAEEALKTGRKMSLEELLPKYLEDFMPVFKKASFNQLPERHQWDHAIELKPEVESFNSKIYPLSLAKQAELDTFIEEHLHSGRIRPSKSPIASPFFFIKKKDGSLRPVQDYHKLNTVTIKNQYPLPLISEVVHKLRDVHYFTKLDVRWGYNNICIQEGDKWKTAFTTNRGIYEPLVMFFGLINSPATF